jgi:hypothetical protein
MRTYDLYKDNVLFHRIVVAIVCCTAKLRVIPVVLSSVHDYFQVGMGVLPATLPRHQGLLLDSCTSHFNNDMHGTISIVYHNMPP